MGVNPSGEATDIPHAETAQPQAETSQPAADAQPQAAVDAQPSEDQSRPRRSHSFSMKAVLLGAGLAVVLMVLLIGGDMLVQRDHIPRGVTVAGVQIGGKTRTAAQEELQKSLDGLDKRSVEVCAGDVSSTVVPHEIGLGVDYEATLDAAGRPSWNPIVWLQSFGSHRNVDVVSRVDETLFSSGLERVLGELNRKPENGDVSFDAEGQIVVRDAIVGQKVQEDELRKTLESSWTDPEKLEVSVEIQQPEIEQVDVDKAIGMAYKALTQPIEARGIDGVTATIKPSELKDVVAFVPEKGFLEPKLNMENVGAILGRTLAQTETSRRNATVVLRGDGRDVTPSVDGYVIDWKKTLENFDLRLLGDDPRTFDVIYRHEPAAFTTEQAKTADFNTVIGTFTTSGFSGPSGKNIELVAQKVDGAVVAPGEVFSLNGYTGPRGEAQGYVESGIIIDGHSGTAVGGGISQFATTLYNAAYFAGMEDVEHQAHSYYISRYPAGREATVYEGSIDLKFKNTSVYPVLITTKKTDTDITVTLRGVKTVTVDSVNGGRWAQTSAKSITLSGEDCSPSSGSNGFTTSDTRIISDLAGKEISRTTTTTVYDPSPIVSCQ